MKNQTHLAEFILIFGLLCATASAAECLGFYNGSMCVEFCPAPKVNDVSTMTCLTNPDACTDAYFGLENVCTPVCPEGTILGFTPTQKKLCLPLDVKAINASAASLTCSTSQVLNLITAQCTTSTTVCTGVLIPQIRVCLAACPNEYNKVVMKDANNNDIQTCQLKPYVMPQACTGTQVRNRADNTCLASVANCVGFYVERTNSCDAECPLDLPVLESVANATYQNCKPPANPCSTSQTQNVVTSTQAITCLNSASECTGFYNAEANVCVDTCPEGNVQKSVENKTYKICVPCPLKDQQGNCYEVCPSSMKLDLQRRLCLSGTSADCKETEYFVKLTQSCVATCPFGTVPSQQSGPKECVPCTQTTAGCPDQSSQCTQKLSADRKQCGPECPNMQFALAAASGQTYQQCKLCEQTSQFVNFNGDACVSNCGSGDFVADRATRRCISQASCLGFVFTENAIKQCGKECPKGQQTAAPADGASFGLCTACPDGKFLDANNTCVSTCTLYDANKTSCLASINDCKGFILSDNTCGMNCATGEFIADGAMEGQFRCFKACPSGTFTAGNRCVKQCLKGTFPDKVENKCVEISKCTEIVSFDGKNCVTACEPGQFVQVDTKSNLKVCKVCNEKISADGSKCASECGASEVFDFDLKKCLNGSDSATCTGKIYSSDKKSCSSQCPKGQLLQVTAATGAKQCLTSPTACANIVSADLTQCVTACQSNEAAVTVNGSTFCRPCPFGPNDTKTACKSSDACVAATQLFDLDLKACVAIASCSAKLLSVDGKKCGTKCQFPEVTRIAASTTQCYADCEAGEIRVPGKGCVAATECTGYISAGNGSCVEECVHVREAIDSTTSVPKTCKLCAETETPAVIVSGGKKVIECQTKTSDDPSTQATGMKDILGLFTKIDAETKSNIKSQVSSVSETVEAAVKALKDNQELTDSERKAQKKAFMDSLKEMAKSFSQKVEQTAGSGENESQLVLGSSEYSLVTESLKEGNVFNLQFSLTDFLSSSSTSLQVDPSTLSGEELVQKTSSSISTLQAVNEATNPYCQDSTKCSKFGLFSIDYTVSGAARRLSASDGQVFSTVYSVSSEDIKKTICVSYDTESGEMAPAVSTSADSANSTITCVFYSNSDLYLDSSCEYIDQSFCTITTPVKNDVTITNDQPTSGLLNVFSMTLLVAIFAFISL